MGFHKKFGFSKFGFFKFGLYRYDAVRTYGRKNPTVPDCYDILVVGLCASRMHLCAALHDAHWSALYV